MHEVVSENGWLIWVFTLEAGVDKPLSKSVAIPTQASVLKSWYSIGGFEWILITLLKNAVFCNPNIKHNLKPPVESL